MDFPRKESAQLAVGPDDSGHGITLPNCCGRLAIGSLGRLVIDVRIV